MHYNKRFNIFTTGLSSVYTSSFYFALVLFYAILFLGIVFALNFKKHMK